LAVSLGVLYVCTGNICRSPLAERLLLARLVGPDAGDVRVVSAGTRAVVGHQMDDTSAQVLSELGGRPEGHVAQQLRPELVEQADLILTATSAHRSGIVRSTPAAMRKVFTMREFARLGAGLPPPRPGPNGGKLIRRVGEVAGRRGFLDPPADGQDEIADPIGAPLPLVRECGQQISVSVDAALRILGLAP
jgi:protein-tyrosine phosphatase